MGPRYGSGLLLVERFAPTQTGGDLHDLRQLPASRRVGGEEPGGAGQDEPALLRSRRPRVELADGGLDHLIPVEARVLGEQRATEDGDRLGRVAAAGEEPVDDGAGAV